MIEIWDLEIGKKGKSKFAILENDSLLGLWLLKKFKKYIRKIVEKVFTILLMIHESFLCEFSNRMQLKTIFHNNHICNFFVIHAVP